MQAEELGVSVEAAAKSLQVRWRGPDDVDYALGGITPEGKLKTKNINWKPDNIGRIDLAHDYLARVDIPRQRGALGHQGSASAPMRT